MTQAAILAASGSQGVSQSLKNRIINGAMVIDQRNAGDSVTPTGSTYTLDRWIATMSVASKFSIQQNAGSVTPPVGFVNYLGVTSTSAYTVGAAENFVIQQRIEGYNIADLGWGTANAKTVTLSFWVRSSLTGTFGGSVRNGAADRSYPYLYTISSANTWEYKTITVAGETTGTWTTTNANAMALFFSLGVGSTNSGTAGTWASTNYTSATGATSVVGTSGATFYITGVQLEVGTTATNFDFRSIGTELALCQRYFEKTYEQSVVPGTGAPTYGIFAFNGTNTTGTTSYIGHAKVYYKVTKRATPTFSTWDNANPANSGKSTRFTLGVSNNDNQNVSLADPSDSGVNVYSSGTSSNTGIIFHFTASAEL